MWQTLTPWLPTLVSFAATAVVLGLGGLLTRIGPWYRALARPSWQPPDWLFGPAWTTIGILTALAAIFAWERVQGEAEAIRILMLFALNAILNIAWSALFFRMQRPDWALTEVIALWLSILALVLGLWPMSTTAGLLLLPYLAWVTFAAYLNLTIVRLNPRMAPGKMVPQPSADRR